MIRRSLYFMIVMVLMVWPVVSQAQYNFRLLDVPFTGARNTTLTSVVQGEPRGVYEDLRSQTHGFLETCAGEIQVFPLLSLRASSAACLAGWYTARTGRTTGWLFQQGTFLALEGPRDAALQNPTLTEALDTNEACVTVGTYRSADNVFHGFRFTPTPGQRDTIDAPGAAHTALVRIDNAGRILVRATAAEGTVSYHLLDGSTFTPLAVPALPNLELVGRLANGVLIGNTNTSAFTWDGSTVTLIHHPDPATTLTQLFGNDEAGRLYGRVVIGGVSRGFLAIPTGTPDPCEADPPEGGGTREKQGRGHTKPR